MQVNTNKVVIMCKSPEAQAHYLSAHKKSGLKKLTTLQRRLKRLHDAQDGKCYWCRRPMLLWWAVDNKFYRKNRKITATVEHLLPQAHGGTSHVGNLAAACYECNTIRATIAHDAFKWVSSIPARFERFKYLKKKRRELAMKLKINTTKERQAGMVFNLALLFLCHNKYGNNFTGNANG